MSYPTLPPIPSINDSVVAVFMVVGHTTLVSPDVVNSSAFQDTYGPVHISPSIAKFDVVFFHDAIPLLGDPVLEIPVTIHGNPYTVTMQRVEPEDSGASTPLYSYFGKLSSAAFTIFLTRYLGGNQNLYARLNSDSWTMFGVYFQNDTLLHGSIAVPGETIVIRPLQTR